MDIDILANETRKKAGSRVVYLTNESTADRLLDTALENHARSTRVIRDVDQLNDEIKHNRYNKYVGRYLQGLETAARTIASAPVAKYEGMSWSLGGLASVDKQSSRTLIADQKYFIFEDGIDPTEFGRFLSFFSHCDHLSMPTIVMSADRNVSSLHRKLSHTHDKFDYHEFFPGGAGDPLQPQDPPTLHFGDILGEVAANNFLSVSCANFDLEECLGGSFDDLTRGFAALYAQIKAIMFEYDKFRARPLVSLALGELAQVDRSALQNEQRKILDVLRILLTLTDLYSREQGTERLDLAVSLAEGLKAEVLKAHCFRLINMHTGYGEFSAHCLSEAEQAFWRADQDIMALYSKNNRLLNSLHLDGAVTDEFKELVSQMSERAPTSSSMVQILNNAMVAATLDTRTDEALDIEEQARAFNALPIHRLGLEVNSAICRFVRGESVDEEALDQLLARMDRYPLDDFYAYHQTIIGFNILEIKRQSGLPTTSATEFLRRRKFFDYESVLDGTVAPATFLLDIMPTTRTTKAYRGQRGSFIDATRLIPIVHFAWM